MFGWHDLSNFEVGVTVLLFALWVSALAIYGKLSYLVRIKVIELRKSGVLDEEK